MNQRMSCVRVGTVLGLGAVLVFLLPSLGDAQIRLRRNFGKKEQFSCASNPQRCASTSISRARSHLPQIYRHDRNLGRQVESQLNRLQSELNRLNNLAGPGSGFRTIDPFGDYLFHGVPIRPKDGNLVTRHLDPEGFAARAEEWAQELGRMSRELDTRQGEERRKFISELSGKLELAGLDAQHQLQLSDLSGGQALKSETLGEELTIAGLPALEGDTPALLRDPFEHSALPPESGPDFYARERLSDAVRAPGETSIDRIYVPPPSFPENPESGAFDWQRLRDGHYLGTAIGEDAAQWWADHYAATESWYGRAGYGAGGLGASLWTPDTYLETVTTLSLASEADMVRRALLKAAARPKHVFINSEQVSNIDTNAKNIIYHIKYSDGYVKELPWRVPRRIIGLDPAPKAAIVRRASGPPKHIFLSADEFDNIDINARNIIYHIQHPDGAVKTMRWFVNY